MGNGPLFSYSILSFHLDPLFFLPCTFAPLHLCVFFFSGLFFSGFSSSQPRQEQQPEPGTFGV